MEVLSLQSAESLLKNQESAVKRDESQVTETEEPARIPDECQREKFLPSSWSVQFSVHCVEDFIVI
jgi:hypothetical protein